MPLPPSDKGMDTIVNVNCISSKQIILWATKKEINSEELAMEYLKYIVLHKGIPCKVIATAEHSKGWKWLEQYNMGMRET